jgi:hypothetical protein
MTFAVIINLTAAIALLILLTATMRLPYRLSVGSGGSRRRARHATERSTRRAGTPVASPRRAQPEPEMT